MASVWNGTCQRITCSGPSTASLTFPVSASTWRRTTALGRPSIDPRLLIRMLIVGYCFGIRSERRLCEEVHLNLAHRWFCRLGLEGDVPDHSTFSKTRHGRFRDADLLRELFEIVVRRCMREGFVGGEGFAVDASMIVVDAHRQRGIETAEDLDPKAKRAVVEYLATLDDAAFGAATPVDPAARWTASWGGPAVYAYCTNYLIDVEHAIIVDVEASTAVRQPEVTAAKTVIERKGERWFVALTVSLTLLVMRRWRISRRNDTATQPLRHEQSARLVGILKHRRRIRTSEL